MEQAIEGCDEQQLADCIDEAKLLGPKFPYQDELAIAEQALYALTGAEWN